MIFRVLHEFDKILISKYCINYKVQVELKTSFSPTLRQVRRIDEQMIEEYPTKFLYRYENDQNHSSKTCKIYKNLASLYSLLGNNGRKSVIGRKM